MYPLSNLRRPRARFHDPLTSSCCSSSKVTSLQSLLSSRFGQRPVLASVFLLQGAASRATLGMELVLAMVVVVVVVRTIAPPVQRACLLPCPATSGWQQAVMVATVTWGRTVELGALSLCIPGLLLLRCCPSLTPPAASAGASASSRSSDAAASAPSLSRG